jgi:hypothetical protein
MLKLGMVDLPVIPALGRLRQEDFKVETSLGYIARWCLKQTNVTLYPRNM